MAFEPSLRHRISASPDIVHGAIYMTFAALCFALMNVLVRDTGAQPSKPSVWAFTSGAR
jgi:hypothetical protein